MPPPEPRKAVPPHVTPARPPATAVGAVAAGTSPPPPPPSSSPPPAPADPATVGSGLARLIAGEVVREWGSSAGGTPAPDPLARLGSLLALGTAVSGRHWAGVASGLAGVLAAHGVTLEDADRAELMTEIDQALNPLPRPTPVPPVAPAEPAKP